LAPTLGCIRPLDGVEIIIGEITRGMKMDVVTTAVIGTDMVVAGRPTGQLIHGTAPQKNNSVDGVKDTVPK